MRLINFQPSLLVVDPKIIAVGHCQILMFECLVGGSRFALRTSLGQTSNSMPELVRTGNRRKQSEENALLPEASYQTQPVAADRWIKTVKK